MENTPFSVPEHKHDGIDNLKIEARNITDLPAAEQYLVAVKQMPWTQCQDGFNYRYMFMAPVKCEIVKIGLYWRNGGTSSTVVFYKDYAAGTPSAVACSDTFATNSRDSSKTYWEVPLEDVSGGIPVKQFNTGDILSCWSGGTLTNLKDLTITVYFKVL